MLVLVPLDDLLLFQYLKSVSFPSVLFLDKQYFAVGTFTDDTDLGEILSCHGACLFGLLCDDLLVLFYLLLALDYLA